MATIETRRERKRGCGWRKPGGLYLISGGLSAPCGKLPIPLTVCPTCGGGIKPSRGWTWIDGGKLIAGRACLYAGAPHCMAFCPLSDAAEPVGQVGLIWIGERFYATVSDFEREADRLGVSRRIPAVPKDFKLGTTWVWLAHRKAISEVCPQINRHPSDCQICNGDGWRYTPAVFRVFKPTAVEYVVTGDETTDDLDRMAKRGITPVEIERIEEQQGVLVE